MKIAIYGSRRQQPYVTDIRNLLYNFVDRQIDIDMHEKLYRHLTEDLGLRLVGVNCVRHCPSDADLTISLGGDGTFLRTVGWLGDNPVPVLGINTGHLGFLTAISLEQALADPDRIARIDFRRESLTMLRVTTPDTVTTALNEVVVAKEDSASMITASIKVNDTPLSDYKADGVLLATPTGSTAYNLSVGGPIVEPEAPVWILSPIAAHSLTLRPLVLSDSAKVSITVTGRGAHFRVVTDGRPFSLPMGASIEIERAPHRVIILQPQERDFARILSDKLLFNG